MSRPSSRILLNTYRTLSNGDLTGCTPITFSVPQTWLQRWLQEKDYPYTVSQFLAAYTWDDALYCAEQAKQAGVFRYHHPRSKSPKI